MLERANNVFEKTPESVALFLFDAFYNEVAENSESIETAILKIVSIGFAVGREAGQIETKRGMK